MTGSRSLPGGTQYQVGGTQGSVPPGQGWVTPPSQVRMGLPQDKVPPGMGTPSQGWHTPQPGMAYPQPGMGYPQDRTADGVLVMRQAVCLLRSRRRTVLCSVILFAEVKYLQRYQSENCNKLFLSNIFMATVNCFTK